MTEEAPHTWRLGLSRSVSGYLIEHGFPGSSLLLRNAYKLLGRAPAGPLRVPTIHGFAIWLDPRRHKGVDASIYFNGTYEAGSLHVITRTLRPGDTFIDAGANIGLMSLAARQAVGPGGTVHAFEPVPEVHRILQENIDLNGFQNVRAHCLALGARAETLTIYEQPEVNKGSASLVKPAGSNMPAHQVKVVSLDAFVEQSGIASVRMIKADVEGWELELVRGASKLLGRRDAPALCIEYSVAYSPSRERLPDLYQAILAANDYRVFKLKYGKECRAPLVPVRGPEDLPRHDNIFCFLPSQVDEIGARLFE